MELEEEKGNFFLVAPPSEYNPFKFHEYLNSVRKQFINYFIPDEEMPGILITNHLNVAYLNEDCITLKSAVRKYYFKRGMRVEFDFWVKYYEHGKRFRFPNIKF